MLKNGQQLFQTKDFICQKQVKIGEYLKDDFISIYTKDHHMPNGWEIV